MSDSSREHYPARPEPHDVELVAYLVGNPWPICHHCKRHVYLIEATGRWEHFA